MLCLQDLCSKIQMPQEVTQQVLQLAGTIDFDQFAPLMNRFFQKENWGKAIEELRACLAPDENGVKMLTCMLFACLDTYQMYQKRKIEDQIFFDTMGCFSRFVKEHHQSYGIYGFDRDWWTCRELSMQEFRIGELEYELTQHDGKEVIHLHIPSDAKLTTECCHDSLKRAKQFFQQYFPQRFANPIYCHSWLLAPNLKEVLQDTSNILKFQSEFEIERVDLEETDFMEWVFKRRDLPLDQLPQNTSLQIRLKEYLQKGGKIGSALGALKQNAFMI